MKQIILSALLILLTTVFSKGPCDQKEECKGRVFGPSDRALCSGQKACEYAEFGTTDYNPICVGAQACQRAKITDAPKKMLCNGFQACKGIKRGIQATEKIACNGLKSCEKVVGSLTAPQITCDGDLGCQYKKLIATGPVAINGITIPGGLNDITINGHKAAEGGNLISDNTINCDGDASCKDARLEANQIFAGGKRAAYGTKIFGASKVYAYGFNSIASGQVKGPDKGRKSLSKWTFEVRALGFNALTNSVINSNGAFKTTILGYGYRSLVNAVIKCIGKSECTVTCRMNACKGARIFVAGTADLIMDPIECDPRDPNYVGLSKKDGVSPGKAFGVNCPLIMGPGAKLTEEEIDEMADKYIEEYVKSSSDYLEMVEATEQAEAALDAMIQERVAVFEEYLDLDQLSAEEQEEFMVVEGHTINNNSSSSNILTSNLLTALIVFIMTSVGSLCYIAYRFGGNDETKALLQ